MFSITESRQLAQDDTKKLIIKTAVVAIIAIIVFVSIVTYLYYPPIDANETDSRDSDDDSDDDTGGSWGPTNCSVSKQSLVTIFKVPNTKILKYGYDFKF